MQIAEGGICKEGKTVSVDIHKANKTKSLTVNFYNL